MRQAASTHVRPEQRHIPGRRSSAASDTSGLLHLYSSKALKDEGKVLLQRANAGQRSEGESHLFLLLHLDKPHPSLVFFSTLYKGAQAYKHLHALCAETSVKASVNVKTGVTPQEIAINVISPSPAEDKAFKTSF